MGYSYISLALLESETLLDRTCEGVIRELPLDFFAHVMMLLNFDAQVLKVLSLRKCCDSS